jgi:hypothetical protein
MSKLSNWITRHQNKLNIMFCCLSLLWIAVGIMNQTYGLVLLHAVVFFLCYRGIRF